MNLEVNNRFSFGEFELDADRRLLLKRGEAVNLNPKTFDLLLTLVQNHGNVLSKNELLDRVWENQFVEENNLTVHIAPDGNFIACGYRSDRKTKLAIVPLIGGASAKFFDVPSTYNFDGSIRWTRDGKSVTYRDWTNGIWSQSIDGGEPKRLAGLPAEKLYHYEWSPDGKHLAFTRGREVRDVVLISDFR